MEELLGKILDAFESRPATSGRLMRELLEKDRCAFQAAASRVLRKVADHRGYRYLIALLAGNDLLVPLLCDPHLSMTAAVALANIGIQVHRELDTALTRRLLDQLATRQNREADALRILNILEEISNGPRLLPWLHEVLRHPNARLRSKVALLIGRRSENPRWVAQHKQDSDPRVRANAIESLWGMEDDGARHALWDASRDDNNRVAGNALLGLHRIGDARAIDGILAMAAHGDSRFRATAAWVMGESADPRFLGTLGKMLADGEPLVRTRAFPSLARLRRRAATLEQSNGLRIWLWQPRLLSGGERQVCVASVAADGSLPVIAGTEFVISEGTRSLTQYTVRRQTPAAQMAVGFALPRVIEAESPSFESALIELLEYKKPGHAWAITRYSTERAAMEISAAEPRFTAKKEALAEFLNRRALRNETSNCLSGAARLLLASAATVQGERHLVLVGVPGAPAETPEETAAVADTARLRGLAFHGVSIGGGGAEILRVLCGLTGGTLLEAGDHAATRVGLQRIFWGLQSQNEIRYRLDEHAAQGAQVRVEVWSELGMAADSAALR